MIDYGNAPPPRTITPATLAAARSALWATAPDAPDPAEDDDDALEMEAEYAAAGRELSDDDRERVLAAYARRRATTLATPGQRVTHHDRPRPLGPTEHLVRCSSCSEPTIVLLPDGPDGPTAEALDGVRCGACLRPAEVPPCPR